MPINDPQHPRPPKKPVVSNADMYYDAEDAFYVGIKVYKWDTVGDTFITYPSGTYTVEGATVSVNSNGDITSIT